jgi:hypothetical protein
VTSLNAGEEKLDLWPIAGGNAQWRSLVTSYQTKHTRAVTRVQLGHRTPGHLLQRNVNSSPYKNLHGTALFLTAKEWKQSICSSMDEQRNQGWMPQGWMPENHMGH